MQYQHNAHRKRRSQINTQQMGLDRFRRFLRSPDGQSAGGGTAAVASTYPAGYPGTDSGADPERGAQDGAQQIGPAEEARALEYAKAGKAHEFYTSSAWLKTRDQILRVNHWECRRCWQRGRYSRATVVHHQARLKQTPARALDPLNLEPLCDACHWEEHHREPEPLTPERW